MSYVWTVLHTNDLPLWDPFLISVIRYHNCIVRFSELAVPVWAKSDGRTGGRGSYAASTVDKELRAITKGVARDHHRSLGYLKPDHASAVFRLRVSPTSLPALIGDGSVANRKQYHQPSARKR